MRLGKIWPKRKRLTIAISRFEMISSVAISQTQMNERFSKVRVQRDRSTDVIDRHFRPATTASDQAKQVPRVHTTGFSCKYLPIDRLRLL